MPNHPAALPSFCKIYFVREFPPKFPPPPEVYMHVVTLEVRGTTPWGAKIL